MVGARAKTFRLEAVQKNATGAAEGSAASRVWKFRANDGDWDRYQDRLRVEGWQLDNFNALQGPILYNHDAGTGGFLGLGKKDVLPIGKGRAYVEGDALFVDIEFDDEDEFAQKVERKIQKGMLGAVSVRYVMHKYHENERGGYDSEEHELLEISIVTIPGNQRALRVKSLGAEEQEFLNDIVGQVAERLFQLSTSTEGARDAADRNSTSHNGAVMDPEQIKQLQAENEALRAKAAEIEAKEKQAAEEAAMQARIDAAVAKQFEDAKANRSDTPPVMAEPARAPVTGKRVAEGTGIDFARLIKAKAVAKMEGRSAGDVLKGWGYTDTIKALGQENFSGMGSLVPSQVSGDFIELLRNRAVLRQAGARVVPMGASLVFDGQSAAASASYGGSTEEIEKSEPSTNKPLKLSEKKLRGLVLIPNDLIRNASVGAEEFVRDDLLQVMALKEDEKFFYGAGTEHEPLGLKAQLKSTHKFAMTALATAGVPTVAEVKKQLDKVLKLLKKANAPMRNLHWFLSPSIEAAILSATGPGAEGMNQLEREMTERGVLRAKPFHVTNQIPETSTADLFIFDMSEVIIGESMGVEAEVFPNGTITHNGTTISGISTDQTIVRAITKHDIGLRHDVSGACVTGMTWGI